MKEPHILLAANNCQRLKRNLAHIIDSTAIQAIEDEINSTVSGLFRLGVEHYQFAASQSRAQWRQIISRLYYGAYNVSRSVRLHVDGHYHTDSDDHKRVKNLPDDFPNKNTYSNQLESLRSDRNLCDYDHTADEADLLISSQDALALVQDFINEARNYLTNRGMSL
jgi:hypothetical protein